jgi:hypothetical protein
MKPADIRQLPFRGEIQQKGSCLYDLIRINSPKYNGMLFYTMSGFALEDFRHLKFLIKDTMLYWSIDYYES